MSISKNGGIWKGLICRGDCIQCRVMEKKSILFVCHGNICRSPMAEFAMKDLAAKAGRADEFLVESAAVSSEELGNPVYPPARELLAKRGISCKGKTARKMSRADYDRFDLILVMDNSNMRNIMRIVGSDPKGKIKMLMEYAGKPHAEVADPWYSGDFEETWRDVSAACGGLLASL